MWLATAVFLVTLTLVIWQPRGLGIGWSACAGALVALLTGSVSVADIAVVWSIVWNATGSFIAVVIISLVLDAAGFFEWAALYMGRWGRGRGRYLFVLMVLLGAVVTAIFNNDGAALILTPIVMAMLMALGFSPAATLAYVMAAGFIADTASLPLVVSNLVNIVSADYFNIGFVRYASVMVPVNLVAVAASLLVLMLFFRKDIPVTYALDHLRVPSSAIRDRVVFRAGWCVLALLLAGFFGLEPLGVPVSVVAALGAAVLLVVAARSPVINPRQILRTAPWHIVVFSMGMYLVVYGLRNAGLTHWVTAVLDQLAAQGLWVATLGTGLLVAVLSAFMNNLPAVLIGALSVDASAAQGVVREAMVFANVVGSDLGPKMTPIGSLATLLWLHVLSRRGMIITWGYYFRVGVVLTLPVLVLTLLALAFRLSFEALPVQGVP
ncbi:MAG: arsenic transporter [Alcaligenaceae bacterium]|nr:arsenic transporter [Alcaligenaceae bacterium]